MNSKEFRELKKTLEAKVNESIRGFNMETHFNHGDEARHMIRVSQYVEGVNEVLKTIAANNDLKYNSVKWPTYDPKLGAIYSEVRI